MISPVDGVDPYGFIREYCITPGEKLNFETPTLIISAGLDGVPGICIFVVTYLSMWDEGQRLNVFVSSI